MTEIWKSIDGFPDYEVSNMGRVKSFKWYHGTNERILKLRENNKGYIIVSLYNKKTEKRKVHILVYETFYDDKIKLDECIHHKDKNKKNNNYMNLLKIDTHKHNSFHNKGKIISEKTKKLMSEKNSGRNNPNFGIKGLEEWKINSIHQISNSPIIKQLKITQKEIGEIFGIDQKTVSYIKNRTWL